MSHARRLAGISATRLRLVFVISLPSMIESPVTCSWLLHTTGMFLAVNSEQSPMYLRAPVPAVWRSVLAKAMAEHPEARWRTARQFAAAIPVVAQRAKASHAR